MRSIIFLLTTVLAILTTGTALAWNGAADCNDSLTVPSSTRLHVARIDGQRDEKIHFWKPDRELVGQCPAAGEAICKAKAYLVNRDIVVTSIEDNGYVCSGFITGKGTLITGWIPKSSLTPLLEPAHPAMEWWQGDYRGVADRFTLTPDGENLVATMKRINGETLVFRGKPEVNEVILTEIEEGLCFMKARLFANYLIIEDSDAACGGSDLRGFYRNLKYFADPPA